MPDEFDLALEAKLSASDAAIEAEETPEEIEETEVTAEQAAEEPAEPEAQEQARDDAGRFLPKFDDPDIQSYIEKFGGDISQALRSAVEAQSLIGRQGQELGELRALRQEMEAIRQQISSTPAAPAALPSNTQELLEDDPGTLAQWAFENGRQDVYDQAMDAWFELAPRQASRFEQAVLMGEMQRQMESRIEPIATPLAEQSAAREIVQAQRELGLRFSDFNEILGTATEAELAGFPRDVAEKAQTGTYQEKISALETLYRWVKAERLLAGPMTQTDTTDAQRQAEAEEAKQQAVVVSASSAPAREGKSGVQEFKNFLLEPDPTNWRTGLGE